MAPGAALHRLPAPVRLAALLLAVMFASCETPPPAPPGTPPPRSLHFVQALSASGGLVESYRFDSVRSVPIPDSYSVLPTPIPAPPAKVLVDHRYQRVYHISAPTAAGTSSVRSFEMRPITGLVASGTTFTITGELIALHPSGRFLLTREAPDAANPTQSRVHARPVTTSPLTVGTAVTSLLPANAAVIFSTDGAHAYAITGTVAERPQGVVGQIILTRCDFDTTSGAFATCDAPMTIDTQPFGGQCPSNQVCELRGYDGEFMAIDPQMRLLYVTAVASLRFGGNITSNRETWAVRLGADRKLVATGTQRISTVGKLVAEPHGRFLFIASPTKLESWAIDANTLTLANSAGASGLGEPARVSGRLAVDCDDGGNACVVFSSAGMQLFSWSAATSTYTPGNTRLPVGSDTDDVWISTGSDPLRVWPQDAYVGSNDESRVDIIRFDLLGAVQTRSTQSLVVSGRPVQTVETISQDPTGALCVALRPNPLSNDVPSAQRFLIFPGGTLSRSPVLGTRGGQTAIERDPGRNGNYEMLGTGLRLSTESDCSGFSSIVSTAPGVPRQIAVDPLGRRIYVMSFIDARLTMFPINRGAAAAGAARPFGPPQTVSTVPPTGLLMVTDLDIDERGERLFATIANRDQLIIMDLDPNTGMPILPAQVRSTGQWPAAVAVSPDNRNLYVLNATGRTISRFGAAPGFAATGTTPLPAITGTPQAASTEPRFGFEVASTGQLLYVSDYDADQFQLWGINETDGSLTLRTPVAMPGAGAIWAVNRRF